MRLNRIEIKNYRSIKELDIKFDPKCRILVGINESGKTNILDALNLLDPEVATTPQDLREAGRDEPPITTAHVRFIFDLTKEEMAKVVEQRKRSVLAADYTAPIIEMAGSEYPLQELCESQPGLYVADIVKSAKRFGVFGLKTPKIVEGWKKVGPECPTDFKVQVTKTREVLLSSFTLVNSTQFPDIPSNFLVEATVDDVQTPIATAIKKEVEANLLHVLFWNYDEKKLLPPRIDLEEFCGDPDTCLPLKRMFQLYGTTDINAAVTAAKAGSANTLSNMLERVAIKTSRHFHNTWREYDGIQFSLTLDGQDVVAGIRDQSNRYALAQRSDGFKRFVTFLLLVSAEAATDSLKDTLLLIDEPEIGLHPTGARYLMNELIKISENNYVAFSTHSIFMIDSKLINRHLIVKKDDEITSATEASESNIQDEEVIYKSLGYSIFANLKPKNLVFEGWRDKKLFETALTRVPGDYEDVKKLKGVGRCFVQGVKQMKLITPLLEAGDRMCLILSDADATARQKQAEYQRDRGYGLWKRYDELVPGATEISGEDFIKESAFKASLEELKTQFNIPGQLPDLALPIGKVLALRQWLLRHGLNAETAAKAVESVKDQVFKDLKVSEINAGYYDYLLAVWSVVDKM
jgi:hypothetical protein